MLRTYLLLAALTALFMAVGFALGGGQGMAVAFGFALFTNIISYWHSDKIVLRMYRAQPLTEADAPELLAATQTLAQRAGIPMPKLYRLPAEQPNAFATGRNPDHAAVAVSDGLLRLLEPDEVHAVIAHELAHIKHRDTLIMTVTATLAGAIGTLANFAMFFGGRDASGQARNPLATLAIMLLAPFMAMLVQLAISRHREYKADAGGAESSGTPEKLATALQKIQRYAKQLPNPVAESHPATAHLFISNPLAGRGMDNLFATHPSTENRIAALMQMQSPHAPVSESPPADTTGPWSRKRPSLRSSFGFLDRTPRT